MKSSLLIALLGLSSLLRADYFDPIVFIEENHGKFPDTTLARMAFDSLSYFEGEEEGGIYWHGNSFHESPDGRLKIYHFLGEGCGAYCNPNYHTIVAFKSGETYQFDEAGIYFEIDSVIHFQDDFYLIFGLHNGRPRGIEGNWGQSVELVLIDEQYRSIWDFQSTTSNLVEVNDQQSSLTFDPETETISYTFDWYEDWEDFRSYRETGIWEFSGITFELIDTKTTYYDEN